ncbi:Gfo/Idh/MocA family oxidoreductase [Aggregatimonas sangjinii]|uniref:Gfo/Idh/MocA family oxidoreductase n=1 Tax=Aggregatimonas sangjinii TaxID=2583587 RepID=A0A5B7SRG3_9FLAO|nr:Gfo/Idh/MocA family oxidoreductase [Aggregatimonas sangjinii]QCX01157.1 Gfo/Idh/MocA family oxidoreductase [Aggregatimonas sangjinii]
MATLGVGVIGTGSIVNTYVKCLAELEDAELIALYTTTPSRVIVAKNLFGAPVLTELEEFLNHPEIDLVCVCNESGLHGNAAIRAAQSGKHVLSEKPLEVTTEKIDAVIKACKEKGVVLGCVLQNRCAAAYRAVEAVVKNGLLGKLLLGNAHINWYRSEAYYAKNPWRGTKKYDGGAALMNQGIHTIDLLLNLMGEVTSVFGDMKTLVHDIEGEDVGTGILNFKNGAIGTITAGTALFPGYPERLEIYGEKGSILMEGGNIKEWNVQGVSAPQPSNKRKNASGAADPAAIGHRNHKIVLKDMIDAIREKRAPMVDGIEARKAVAVITALYRSSEKEQLIFL